MTDLDTFYIRFKTDASGAKVDIAALDKQITQLATKGKKRSEEEQKEFKALRQIRKESLEDIKAVTKETDALGDSFKSMAQNAIGAATAFATFGALKAGIVDANRLAASLQEINTLYKVSPSKASSYAIALEHVGGNANSMYAFIEAQANAASDARLPFNLDNVMQTLHNNLKNDPGALTKIRQVAGGKDAALLFLSNDEKFNSAIGFGKAHALSDQDALAAQANKAALADAANSTQKVNAQINTQFSGAVQLFSDSVQGFAGLLNGHPIAAAGVGVAGTIGIAGLAKKILEQAATGVGRGLLRNRYVQSALIVTGAGIAAYEYAKTPSSGNGSSTGGSGASNLSNKDQISQFWLSNGYGQGAADGWTANAQVESSFGTKLLGYDKKHFGLYQWSGSRVAQIKNATGIDVKTAGLNDQLRAALWDAQTNYNLTPSNMLGDGAQNGALISNTFEIPSNNAAGLAMEAAKRAKIASSYGNIPSAVSAGVSGKTVNIKIDDIKILTQASDAAGIAKEVGVELKNQIRMAMSNFDDGVAA